jgi:hypothetical protein
MSTNVLDLDSPITGERAKCVRANFWVGPDALKWAAQHPNRRLGDAYRPLGSVDEPRSPRPPEEIYGRALAAMAAELERRAEVQRRKRAERRAARRRQAEGLEAPPESDPRPPPEMNE